MSKEAWLFERIKKKADREEDEGVIGRRAEEIEEGNSGQLPRGKRLDRCNDKDHYD